MRLRVFRRVPAAMGGDAVNELTPLGQAILKMVWAVTGNAGVPSWKEHSDAIESAIKDMIDREIRHRTGN